MAKCFFCDEKATLNCGICQTLMCDKHKHAVNRWHNVYHARWICESCYQQREKKRKIILPPILLVLAVLIGKSMEVRWGLNEPSMWFYFLALSGVALGVTGVSVIFHLVTRSAGLKTQLYRLVIAAIVFSLFLFVYRIVSG